MSCFKLFIIKQLSESLICLITKVTDFIGSNLRETLLKFNQRVVGDSTKLSSIFSPLRSYPAIDYVYVRDKSICHADIIKAKRVLSNPLIYQLTKGIVQAMPWYVD